MWTLDVYNAVRPRLLGMQRINCARGMCDKKKPVREIARRVISADLALIECRRLVRVLALFGVLEDLSGLRIHADFIERLAALHPEGIAKAAAAFFLFKLLRG